MNFKHLGLYGLFLAAGGVGGYQFGLRSDAVDGGVQQGEARLETDQVSGESGSVGGVGVGTAQALASRFQDILALPKEEWREGAKDFFEGMTSENVASYRAALEAMPAGRRQSALMYQFFEKWGELSQREAFDYALSMQGRLRMQSLGSAVMGWAKVEPELAWQAHMEISNEGANQGYYSQGPLVVIAANDLELAARLAFGTEDKSRFANGRIGPLLAALDGADDYVRLIGFVNEFGGADKKSVYLERIFSDWGQYDYEGPTAAIQTMEDSELAKSAMGGLLKGWANSDAAGAFRYAVENQSDPSISDAIPDIVSTWIQYATIEELRSIPGQLAELENYELVMNRAVSQIAQADPKMAYALADGLEEGKLRENSIRSVMATWARSDLDEAVAYLPEIADAEVRTRAASTMISPYMQAKRPVEQIIALAGNAETEKQRENILINIAMQAGSGRYGSDSEKLKEALRQNVEARDDVSESFKERLNQTLDSKPRGTIRVGG